MRCRVQERTVSSGRPSSKSTPCIGWHSSIEMDAEDAYACSCGRSFPGPGPLNFHRRSCQSTKRRLSGALVKVKEIWQSRKKPRLASSASETREPSLNAPPAMPAATSAALWEGYSGVSGRIKHDLVRALSRDDLGQPHAVTHFAGRRVGTSIASSRTGAYASPGRLEFDGNLIHRMRTSPIATLPLRMRAYL